MHIFTRIRFKVRLSDMDLFLCTVLQIYCERTVSKDRLIKLCDLVGTR